jgi:hypothetical protein
VLEVEHRGNRLDPDPSRYIEKIRCTTGAATSSIASTRSRYPSCAFRGFGCGPASTTTYPYGARPP